MKNLKYLLLGMLLCLVISATAANATVEFWIGDAGSSAKIAGNKLDVLTGTNFTLGLYCTSDFTASTIYDLVIGYDASTVTTYGKDKGAGVTGNLTLVSVDQTNGLGYTANPLMNGTSRAASSLIGDKNWYSFDASAARAAGDALTDAKLFEFTFTNNMLAGGEYYISVVGKKAATPEASWNSVLKNSTTKEYDADGYVLTVNSISPNVPAVPEPSSMIALGSGALGLLGFLRRRRS